jgi:hypothetical protein
MIPAALFQLLVLSLGTFAIVAFIAVILVLIIAHQSTAARDAARRNRPRRTYQEW